MLMDLTAGNTDLGSMRKAPSVCGASRPAKRVWQEYSIHPYGMPIIFFWGLTNLNGLSFRLIGEAVRCAKQ